MNCNGQCVLMKKFLAAQKKEQKNPELKFENKNEVYYLSKSGFNYLRLTDSRLDFPRLKTIGFSIDRSSAIFRPPIA